MLGRLKQLKLSPSASFKNTITQEERSFWREFEDACQASTKDDKDREGDASLWRTLAQPGRVWAFGPQTQMQTQGRDVENEDTQEESLDMDGGEGDDADVDGDADVYGAGCILVDARDNIATATATNTETDTDFDFTPHIETGFQLAIRQGPLCAEPVEGLVYFVERVEVDWRRLRKEVVGECFFDFGILASSWALGPRCFSNPFFFFFFLAIMAKKLSLTDQLTSQNKTASRKPLGLLSPPYAMHARVRC